MNSPLTIARHTTVRVANPTERLEWDQLVGAFPGCRITHKKAWLRSLEDSFGAQALYILFEKQGSIVGCLPGLLVNRGPFRIFGSPLEGSQTASMGPVYDDREITTREIIGALVPFLEQQYNVHQIELVTSCLDNDSMSELGFEGKPVLTYRASLGFDNEESLLKSYKPSARRNVKRAIRLGLTARFESDSQFVDEAYNQCREVFAYGGNVISFSKNRVLQYFRHMQQAGTLRAISVYLPDEEAPIATGTFTVDKPELLLWQWAHRREYRWYRPTELMTWTVMCHAMSLGCTTFDLMGGGDFKAKFGAQPDVSKYRWVRSRYHYLAPLRTCARKCYRAQQRVRGEIARLRVTMASRKHDRDGESIRPRTDVPSQS